MFIYIAGLLTVRDRNILYQRGGEVMFFMPLKLLEL